MIRRLLLIAVVCLVVYIALLTQVLEASPPADARRPASISIAELVAMDQDRVVGQAYRTSGRVEATWRVGKLVAMRLTDAGSTITILSNDGTSRRVGDVVTVAFIVQPSVQVGGWSGPSMLIELPASAQESS